MHTIMIFLYILHNHSATSREERERKREKKMVAIVVIGGTDSLLFLFASLSFLLSLFFSETSRREDDIRNLYLVLGFLRP